MKEKKLLWVECLIDGTKIYHYLKPSGDMTLRVEIPKKNVREFMESQFTQMGMAFESVSPSKH